MYPLKAAKNPAFENAGHVLAVGFRLVFAMVGPHLCMANGAKSPDVGSFDTF
jgi:hypothetical protein